MIKWLRENSFRILVWANTEVKRGLIEARLKFQSQVSRILKICDWRRYFEFLECSEQSRDPKHDIFCTCSTTMNISKWVRIHCKLRENDRCPVFGGGTVESGVLFLVFDNLASSTKARFWCSGLQVNASTAVIRGLVVAPFRVEHSLEIQLFGQAFWPALSKTCGLFRWFAAWIWFQSR